MPDKISEIFVKIINEYNRLIDEKNNITINCDVGQKMYHEKCDELDKVLREKEQVEYDRDYYEKYSKELLCEINKV